MNKHIYLIGTTLTLSMGVYLSQSSFAGDLAPPELKRADASVTQGAVHGLHGDSFGEQTPRPQKRLSDEQQGNTRHSLGEQRQHLAQLGFGHEITLIQEGIGNVSAINQGGKNNQALISQSGVGNRASLDQQGAFNNAKIEQYGRNGSATITQYGNRAIALMIQY